jgi:LAO/AO transport system kinase
MSADGERAAAIRAALSGDRRALARLISRMESDAAERAAIMAALYSHTGRAHVIGVTGAPGSGKSTLVGQLAAAYRERGFTVAIVAVDPSSSSTGGALLGDRIRMQHLSGDEGVFMRSMASRGELGGLARSTMDVASVLDACGYQRILIETVGAGQSDVEVARWAHTTVLVQVPGMGDDIQALKAGILEVADILAVNKADLEGATRAALLLESMLDLGGVGQPSTAAEAWRPPVLQTVATTGQGIVELLEAIERHRAALASSGALAELGERQAEEQLLAVVREQLERLARRRLEAPAAQALAQRVARRELDPYAAAQEIVRAMGLDWA